MAIKRKRIYTPGGKYIRDSIHGDIFLEDKFVKIIDCPEFQRLRRIKQLSVANMVYPGAEHTRFAHSLGTFYLMSLMIEHFGKQFNEMNIQIEDDDKDIALAAALLHDIGHGPFSHAYEDIHPKKQKNIKHVDWSIRIIKESPKLNSVLKDNFDEDFPDKVANMIKDQRLAKQEMPKPDDSLDLFYVLSRLVSSQMDADRMDYLIRDSFNSGLKLGDIDISRLINSMRITIINNKFDVCIPEKFITDVEKYLLGRYQMHKEVYFHSFKIEMEQVIKKIFNRVHELGSESKINYPSPLIEKVFSDEDLSVEEYVLLDDNIFLSLFSGWLEVEDEVLKKLCEAFVCRNKYLKIEILNKKDSEIDKFKSDISRLMNKFGVNLDKDPINKYYWIQVNSEYSIYNTKKENIWILLSTGLHKDLSTVSNVICRKDSDGENDKLLNTVAKFTYINVDMLKMLVKDNKKNDFEVEIEKLINQYDNRNHVEIEKKYFFKDKLVFEEVLRALKEYSENPEREFIDCDKKYQEDLYYDTNEKKLDNQNCTLRFRRISDKYQLTLKSPTPQLDSIIEGASSSETQSIRFEHQINDVENNISSNLTFILENSDMTIEDCNNLREIILIKNTRHKYELREKSVVLEIVFDDVSYNMDSKEACEYQLEIELKSDYSHRGNLKLVTDYLEKAVPQLETTLDSKFKRGLKLITEECR